MPIKITLTRDQANALTKLFEGDHPVFDYAEDFSLTPYDIKALMDLDADIIDAMPVEEL
jgi:predicted GTPase